MYFVAFDSGHPPTWTPFFPTHSSLTWYTEGAGTPMGWVPGALHVKGKDKLLVSSGKFGSSSGEWGALAG